VYHTNLNNSPHRGKGQGYLGTHFPVNDAEVKPTVTRGACYPVKGAEGKLGVTKADKLDHDETKARQTHNVMEKGKEIKAWAKPRKTHEPQWYPTGLSKTQRRRLQKLHKSEIDKEREENTHDEWFNKVRPMTRPK
jgi:hypothetical protein